MSKVAGILMILLAILTAMAGIKEIERPIHLTPYAAWSSIGLGILILLAGLAHFRAPHKAFLMSVPILIAFVVQVYCFGLFYDVKNLALFVAGHLAAAIAILVLSYLGYRKLRSAA